MPDQALSQYLAAMRQGEAERTMIAEQARLPLGRVAEPDEIAASLVHLALDASYSTGVVLTADGGYTAR